MKILDPSRDEFSVFPAFGEGGGQTPPPQSWLLSIGCAHVRRQPREAQGAGGRPPKHIDWVGGGTVILGGRDGWQHWSFLSFNFFHLHHLHH